MVAMKRPADCCADPVSVEPLPPAERDELVAVLRALGEPMRLEIYRLIAAQDGPLCVCDVVERFPLRQPTISHHLKVLHEVGLLDRDKRGVWVYYSIKREALADLGALLGGVAA